MYMYVTEYVLPKYLLRIKLSKISFGPHLMTPSIVTCSIDVARPISCKYSVNGSENVNSYHHAAPYAQVFQLRMCLNEF